MAADDSPTPFRDELVARGHLIPSGQPGVFGRGDEFERVCTGFDRLVDDAVAPDGAERLRFPPLVPKLSIERVGYLKSFPDLIGAVFGFRGDEAEAAEMAQTAWEHGDWSGHLRQMDVTLTPAGCYPCYPAVAARGRLAADGALLDLGPCSVFRNEPSDDPARLQAFRMREVVRIGTPEQVLEWRERWMRRAQDVFARVELDADVDVANDPFFGRGSRMLAKNQRALQLKFEVLAPIATNAPTAISSFNYHQDHFGHAFGIERHDGEVAHSACLGFGLERVAMALMRRHGTDVGSWPSDVMRELRLDGPRP